MPSILGRGYLSGISILFNFRKSVTSLYSIPISPLATNNDGAAHSEVQGSIYRFSIRRLFFDPLFCALQVRLDMTAARMAGPQVLSL